jgi:hypothetical protein
MKIQHTKNPEKFPAPLTMSIQQEHVEQTEKKENKKEDELTPLEKEEIEALKADAMGKFLLGSFVESPL